MRYDFANNLNVNVAMNNSKISKNISVLDCMALNFTLFGERCIHGTNENDQSFLRRAACQQNTAALTEHAGRSALHEKALSLSIL